MSLLNFRKVVIGISGGVDSAIAALLLKNKGFNVHGVFMKNWDEINETGKCTVESDYEDAQFVCKKLKIPLTQVNFVKEYWNEVFGNFLQDYEAGLTPNPDIICNQKIKFAAFFNHATKNLNADFIATGHYATTTFGPFLENYDINKNNKLLCSIDQFKDQTFFLSRTPQTTLQKTMFPIGNLYKQQVKEIARSIGLSRIAEKKESVGICFIGQRRFQNFISEYIESKNGDFVDMDTGKIVGKHDGLHNWTVGQRCKIPGCLKPYFVLRKEFKENTIYVVSGTDHISLFSDILFTEPPYWIDKIPFSSFLLKCQFRFQHTKPLVNCIIYNCKKNNGNLIVKLETPLRAITPGQYAVFYLESECIGNARIISPSMNFS